MMDLTPHKVFKSSAFEPSDEELTNHARAKRRGRREVSRRVSVEDVKMRSSSPKLNALEACALDDSDDDLPDVSNMFDERPRKRHKKSAVHDVSSFLGLCMPWMLTDVLPKDDLIDLTMDDITTALPQANDASASGSDIELSGITQSPARGNVDNMKEHSLSPHAEKQRSRGRRNQDLERDGPSEAVLATWKRGDDDLEPSAKMLALIELLKEWDSSGDKIICYSQCECRHLSVYCSSDNANYV
jgi:hypothetical protein